MIDTTALIECSDEIDLLLDGKGTEESRTEALHHVCAVVFSIAYKDGIDRGVALAVERLKEYLAK